MRRTVTLLLLLASFASAQRADSDWIELARAKLAAGDTDAARDAIRKALERDEFSLLAIELEAKIAKQAGDNDSAVWALHRLIDVASASGREGAALARSAADTLAVLDTEATTWRQLKKRYLREVLAIAAEHEKKKRMHSALALFAHARAIDPHDPRPSEGVRRVRRTGSADVAVADVYAGGDPTFGKSEEWIEKNDKAHIDWKNAWTFETENYKYRTNAGYRVLMTSSIAMENVNRFYRRFFQFKMKGEKIPKIEIRIFKNRDEYLTLGRNPVEWSGGHFIGDAVETFVGGVTGKESIRRMYGTLFHEAAHHFVSMTSPRCPGWLNEAFASFFEGCEILSNGSVRWNRVPNHRLFPLATRMDRGWMTSPSDGIQADGTGNPERAPTFRMVVEGRYRWGPPWYAPTWGLVYFLHNYRDAEGRPIYRNALQEYYRSFKGRRPRDAVGHFTETVLLAKTSPVKTVDELNDLWKKWILELRDYQQGKIEKSAKLLASADALLKRKLDSDALELLEDAYLAEPANPEVLWRLARLCEAMKRNDRASALYHDLAGELEQRGQSETDPRYATALKKAHDLDPLVQRYERLKKQTSVEGLALARSYLDRQLPTMALAICKRMSAQFSMPEALDLYRQIARATGKTLARWKLVYNERDLRGWSDDGNKSYQAYGREIRARVRTDSSQPKVDGGFTTRALTCDVTFEGDFSLESEMWLEEGKSRLCGLTFGRKDTSNFIALLLHPKGFLDLAHNRGGVWQVLDHRQAALTKGWHKLRVDVAGKNVDFYLDGLWIRTYVFPNDAVARGGFGLITGVGEASYREVRLLARDPHDPSARIERELAMAKIAKNPALRARNTFTGFPPPPLTNAVWASGRAFDPRTPGRVTALLFWSLDQERQLPTLAYAGELARRWKAVGLRVALVASKQVHVRGLPGHLRRLKADDVIALSDRKGSIFRAFGIYRDGFGLPRALLVDIDGTVAFEGDLGLKLGEGWKPGTTTYLDDPLEKLVKTRHLAELKKLTPNLARGKAELRANRLGPAVALLRPLAELAVAAAPAVKEARATLKALRKSLEPRVAAALTTARDYPLRVESMLAAIVTAFAKDKVARLATVKLQALRKQRHFRLATAACKHLTKAKTLIDQGRSRVAAKKLIDKALRASPCAEIRERAMELRGM
ncbi:MAG: hypothetical protein CMJ85_04880 [Planctomycetes bacterium]|nr:hypothetical protein [Planctomycetota bacterium]